MPRILTSSKAQMGLASIVGIVLVWFGMPEGAVEKNSEQIAAVVMALISLVSMVYSLVTGWEDAAEKKNAPSPALERQVAAALDSVETKARESTQKVVDNAKDLLAKWIDEQVKRVTK